MAVTIDGTSGITFPNSTVQASAGKILQVIQTVLPTVFATTSTTYTPITGLTASITPTNSANKIMVNVDLYASGTNGTYHSYFQLTRGGSAISGALATANPTYSNISNNLTTFQTSVTEYRNTARLGISYLDSPSTASSVTYGVQMYMQSGGGTMYINTSASTSDLTFNGLTVSTITLYEVANA